MNARGNRFSGKVALVTGAGGGLGSAIARRLAHEGAVVGVADVAVERGEAAAEAIRADGGRAYFIELDVTSAQSWARSVEKVRKEHGNLHVLVNNAGIVSRSGIRAVSLEEWQRVVAVNLTGAMLGIQSVAPLMRDSGAGSIVNISSTAGLVAYPGIGYSATKWGLRGVTKSAALDLIDWGIRVNSVHPAQVRDSLITSAASAAWIKATARVQPMKRQASADEVVNAVLFLASDESSYINGTEVVVDGGLTTLGLFHVRKELEQEFSREQDQSR